MENTYTDGQNRARPLNNQDYKWGDYTNFTHNQVAINYFE